MTDADFIRLALHLARSGYGRTSPNPMVGAVLVKGGRIIGRGWHRGAGLPHAEVEALQDAQRCGHSPRGATLYVTLEPCCTYGCTPPCTNAIIAAGIKRVVLGTIDPNPKHRGRAFKILRRAGIKVVTIDEESSSSRPSSPAGKKASKGRVGVRARGEKLAAEIIRLNEVFNHWITHRTPFVTVKAAMTLDGKIATASGESKWITGEKARAYAMKLRLGSDAILVGVNTVLADDPSLTIRPAPSAKSNARTHRPRRIILDSMARTPLTARVVSDEHAELTTIVVGRQAPRQRVSALARRTHVIVAPLVKSKKRGAKFEISLRWLLKKLGSDKVTSLLVEGGGEVNASFLLGGLAHRLAFFYAPKILGGWASRKAVAGVGTERLADAVRASELRWRRLGEDHLVLARLEGGRPALT